jgi:hypothetical protein
LTEKVNYKQLGVSGLRRYGGYVYEEFMSQLRWPRAGKIYQEMADNDPVIGAVFYMTEMLIRKVEWSTEPVTDSAEDKEAAEFLKSCMGDMDNSWEDTMSEIISMMTYGFSFHEIVYKVRKGPDETNGKYRSDYTDGKIGWRRLPIRAQRSLHEWVFADDGDIKGFVQLAEPDFKMVTIPLSKGLLFRTRVSRDNPEGKSLLRNAYRPWYFKKRIEEIEGIGIERDLAGLPVLTAPEGMDLWNEADERMVALKANAETLVQSVRRDQEEGILLPNGWDLKLLATGSARQFDTNAIINRYDNRIAITTLSDIILMGGDKTGSFAMAETKQSMLATALESQLSNIAGVFNKYAAPKLFKINGMNGRAKIVQGEIETPTLKEIALLLRAMGVDMTNDMELMNYLRKVASIPQMDEATFKESYKAVAEDKKAADKAKINDNSQVDDTVQNDLEQNDLAYVDQTQ